MLKSLVFFLFCDLACFLPIQNSMGLAEERAENTGDPEWASKDPFPHNRMRSWQKLSRTSRKIREDDCLGLYCR